MFVEAKILGGFPVTIGFTPESLNCEFDWWIEDINGKVCKKRPDWLYKRIEETDGEEDRIIELCLDNC